MNWWEWGLLYGVIMLLSLLGIAGVLFVLCGPPVREWRPEDQEQAQRRAAKAPDPGLPAGRTATAGTESNSE